jgi:chromosome condensin MukBEF ATPase and DNA-binding subunit MukB
MFEKEAKEYATDCEKEYHTSYGACLQTFQDAAAFGYNKGKAELEEVTARLEKQKEINKELVDLQEETIKTFNRTIEEVKSLINDLLDNSDEYARQRAIDFLQEEKEND